MAAEALLRSARAFLFDEAEASGVVLVFDEADALFGKRSDVKDSHDRYANLEISYLLQRMERYRGLAVLTTNLRANLDEAFTRRIGVSIDFPLPGAADRLRMWRRALDKAPCAPDLELGTLAEGLELAGGAILNVAVAAAHHDSTCSENWHLRHGLESASMLIRLLLTTITSLEQQRSCAGGKDRGKHEFVRVALIARSE